MKCQFCNEEIDEHAAFCPHCGKPVSAPVSEPAPEPYAAPVESAATEEEPNKPSLWKKIVLLVGAGCAAATVVFSLIFVFLTGIVYNTSFGGIIEESGRDISYFFKDTFQAIKDLVEEFADSEGSVWFLIGNIFQQLFGFILFVGIVIATVVLACLAISRFIKYFCGNKEAKIGKVAIGTYATYALGAALIRSLYAEKATAMGETANVIYNGATTAGLALGGVFLALYAISVIVVQGKDLLKPAVICRLATCVGTIVFIAVVWDLATNALVGLAEDETKTSYAFLPLLQQGVGFESVSSTEEAMQVVIAPMMCIYGSILLFAMMCTLCSLLARTFARLTEGESKSLLAKAIPVFILSIFITIMAIVAGNGTYADAIEFEVGTLYMTPVIIMAVMSLLVLVGAILESVLVKKFEAKEED